MEALVFSEHPRGTIYARTWSKSRERLESALLELYGAYEEHSHQALIFPSGMGAIGATLAALAQSKQAPFLLLYGDELYCEVPRTVRYVAEAASSRVSYQAVDVTRHGELRKLFREKGKDIGIFHFEARLRGFEASNGLCMPLQLETATSRRRAPTQVGNSSTLASCPSFGSWRQPLDRDSPT